MKASRIIILAAIVVVILAILFISNFLFGWQENNPESLTLVQAMEILNGSSSYDEFLSKAKNFEPELSNYFKFGPVEYEKIKPQWKMQGFEDRFPIIDKINLNNSTYWVELKNKNQGPDLFAILDLKAKKSLLIIGSITIKAGVGL